MEEEKRKLKGHLYAFFCTLHDQAALVLVSENEAKTLDWPGPQWMSAKFCGGSHIQCEYGVDWICDGKLSDITEEDMQHWKARGRVWELSYYQHLDIYDIHGDLVWQPFSNIRRDVLDVCIGLQDLELPALVTLKIVDALFPKNGVRMWAKWELITAVKHFHQRH